MVSDFKDQSFFDFEVEGFFELLLLLELLSSFRLVSVCDIRSGLVLSLFWWTSLTFLGDAFVLVEVLSLLDESEGLTRGMGSMIWIVL